MVMDARACRSGNRGASGLFRRARLFRRDGRLEAQMRGWRSVDERRDGVPIARSASDQSMLRPVERKLAPQDARAGRNTVDLERRSRWVGLHPHSEGGRGGLGAPRRLDRRAGGCRCLDHVDRRRAQKQDGHEGDGTSRADATQNEGDARAPRRCQVQPIARGAPEGGSMARPPSAGWTRKRTVTGWQRSACRTRSSPSPRVQAIRRRGAGP